MVLHARQGHDVATVLRHVPVPTPRAQLPYPHPTRQHVRQIINVSTSSPRHTLCWRQTTCAEQKRIAVGGQLGEGSAKQNPFSRESTRVCTPAEFLSAWGRIGAFQLERQREARPCGREKKPAIDAQKNKRPKRQNIHDTIAALLSAKKQQVFSIRLDVKGVSSCSSAVGG